MSLLSSLLSDIDPSAAPPPNPTSQRPREAQPPKVSKPAQRPAGTATTSDGATSIRPEKRKAETLSDGSQAKIQRKDTSTTTNGASAPTPPGLVARPKSTPPASTTPYRGTAASAGRPTMKPSSVVAKKPAPSTGSSTMQSKPPSANASTSKAAPAQQKQSSYAAMLARAKEAQSKQAAPPPVKNEPMRILTKKERLALQAEAKAAAKGKKPAPAAQSKAIRASSAKAGDSGSEKVKSAGEAGYKGTAQPKKPVEIGYKGTAKPLNTSAGPAGKGKGYDGRTGGTSLASKAKSSQNHGRWDGYADWSDLDDADEEEDYESDVSSDMEGGMWDVEQEEQSSLANAKKEDLEALREENELKRQKEERRRKLMAMNKAAAAKRKY